MKLAFGSWPGLLLAVSLALACGSSVDSRARWTFAIEPVKGATAPVDSTELVRLVRERIPKALRSVTTVRVDSTKELVIEGPLELDLAEHAPTGWLEAPLRAEDSVIVLSPILRGFGSTVIAAEGDPLRDLPLDGGIVCVEGEWIEYSVRVGHELRGLARGAYSTHPTQHPAQSDVVLGTFGRLAELLSKRGDFGIWVEATCPGLGSPADLLVAAAARDAWFTAHPGASLLDYAAIPTSAGGAPEGTRWFAHRQRASKPEDPITHSTLLRAPERPFGSDAIESAGPSTDALGYPALRVELVKARREEFGILTSKLLRCGMAIVIDDEIVMLATVNDRLPGSFVLSGGASGFSLREVEELVHRLCSEPLPATLQLLRREPVAAR